MKAIITGSEGFIGRALASALQSRGAEVIGIDRKNGQEARQIRQFAPDDVDAVFHLAAQTSVFNTDIPAIVEDNIIDFIEVCQFCEEKGVKLVYASSSTANPCNTTSMYGISKRFNEQFASLYLPSATGVRLHNVYGPSPRQGTLLWYLLNQPKVTLYNNGETLRHFTYIGDIVEGLVYAYASNKQLINVANPVANTIRDFSSLVQLHNHVEIECVAETRERDNFLQAVNEDVYTVPLQYTPIFEGIERVFKPELR